MIEANADLKPWRATVTSHTIQAMLKQDVERLDEPVLLACTFYMQRLKGHYGTGKNHGKLKPNAPRFVSVTPDLDKLIRAVQDGITDAGLWRDDSLVAVIYAQKVYAALPGVAVTIQTIRELKQGETNAPENNPVAGALPDVGLQLDI